jgi:serine protease Do
MFESFNQTTDGERAILRKLRVWIVALAAVCVLTGVGVGALLTGRPAVAQDGGEATARAPEALSASFAEIAKRVEPAVVNIDTLSAPEIAEKDNDDKDDQSSNNPFFDTMRRRAQRPSRGVGSGFIIDPKGYILTNQHVIEGATRITIALGNGERFRAKVVGVDQETDLAVIKVDAGRDLPTIKFGDSTAAQVGDWVLAIGSPFGLDQTVTAGIISKQDREPQSASQFQRFMQTDAAINRGNSGGPLLNMRGEAIGVNSQIATLAGEYSGIGFALPSNEAKFVYEQIVANGKVKRGFLGVTLESVRSEFAKVYGLPETRGAIVADVSLERAGQPTPAAKAGLQTNDVIVEFNGQPIQDAQGLIAKVAGASVGQTVAMVFLRDADGKPDRHTASVTLAERPPSPSFDPELPANDNKLSPTKGNTIHLGLTLAELTPQLVTERRLTGVKGLYVKDVDPNGVAADARPVGVSEGEVITRINRLAVTTLADFTRVVSSLKPGDPVVINLSRHDGPGVAQRIVQFTYQ